MKRLKSLAVLLGTVLACGAGETGATELPAGCFAHATREIAFTGPQAKDLLEVTATGPACAMSVVTVAIRKKNGLPISAFALPLTWLRANIEPTANLSAEVLQGLLQSYATDAQLDVSGSTVPTWKPYDSTPGFSDGLELTTPLNRKTYARLRRARANMLCMGDAFETWVCQVWDPASSKSEVILRH